MDVNAGVQELHKLLKDDDMWIKEEGGRDVLDEDKYQQAFPRSSDRNRSSISWTAESSRAVVIIQMNHSDLAYMITSHPWDFLFPNMVATDKIVKFYTSGSDDDDCNPHMSSQVLLEQLHAASPMIATRKFPVVRTCLQIHQEGTWIVAEIPLVHPATFHRLPSGCLIERITDHQSKVTWVEHAEVHTALPNLTSAFAFGAQRMSARLERFCEKWSVRDATCTLTTKRIDVPRNQEKLMAMDFGEMLVRGLFRHISPIENNKSTLLRSVTGPDDLKVHACVYKSFANSEVAGAMVAFPVKHSPDFVLKTLADARKHHEWDVLGGCRMLYDPRKYSTGADPRNISVSEILGSSNEMFIKEVDVNPSGSLVVWSTVSKESLYLICNKSGVSDDSMLISGFAISTDGHTTTSNTCDSVITLVLRMLVEGNQSLQERGQQAMKSITEAINQTVERVKVVLDRQKPPSPRDVPWILKKLMLEIGEMMVSGLFQNISPIENNKSTLLRSVTGPEDLEVHASVYKSFANSEVAGAMVAFPVKHSPDFVLKTLADGRKQHEWDVLRGCTRFKKVGQLSTGGDPRNNISISSTIDCSSNEKLIKQVDVNPSGSLVVWSTVSKECFDIISKGHGVSEDSILISGFAISTDGHTTTSNTCGSVITLVLRMLVEGNQPLQERGQQAMESITVAINQTVERIKGVLDKQQPSSPRAKRLTDDDQSESCKKPRIAK